METPLGHLILRIHRATASRWAEATGMGGVIPSIQAARQVPTHTRRQLPPISSCSATPLHFAKTASDATPVLRAKTIARYIGFGVLFALATAQMVSRADEVCTIDQGGEPFEDVAYCYIQGLVVPETGLVRSQEQECFTTVYKNALAAMAFIHQGDVAMAEQIFAFFQSQIANPFVGLTQSWDPCNGMAATPFNYWEGDNAFMLLALNYYGETMGSFGAFSPLRDALRQWLTLRTEFCRDDPPLIVAEGVANMYAALAPSGGVDTLQALADCFYTDVSYPSVLDHAVRGTLVFGDSRGFHELPNFSRSEVWQCGETAEVHAFSAFSGENYINVEISAQLRATWRIWQERLHPDLSALRAELEKLRLRSQSGTCVGVPFRVRHHDPFATDYSLPIIDSTAWLLFDSWAFNPFAPGKLSANSVFADGFESGDVSAWSGVH